MTHRLLVACSAVLILACSPAQAQRLPGGVIPDHYDLSFDVDLEGARFTGAATIAVRLTVPATRIVLNAADLTIREAVVSAGGTEQKATATLDHKTETLALTVPRSVAAGEAEIRIRYAGHLNDALRGFYLSRDSGRKFAVTQFESTDARRAFPSFDEPAYKATFSLTITAPERATVISNGRALSDTPGPAAGEHTVRFSKTPKMSSYLVAMAIGDFACLEGAADRIPVRVCATSDKKAFGYLALDATRQILPYFNRYFSIPYPFEKLDIVAVPDFAAGAMENTAAIFFREADLLSVSTSPPVNTTKRIWSTLAHEIAHQWFGDLVTMAWWDDLWLNEGFATWMEKRPLAAARPDWRMDLEGVSETQGVMGIDAMASTRAIHAKAETPAEIEESFDSIAYEKGAALVRMIEGYVGGSVFRSAVNAYLEQHAYSNATSEDFWTTVARVSGKPVDRILPTFVNQAGVPIVEASLACEAGRAALTLNTERFVIGRAGSGSPPWQMPICLKSSSSDATGCSVAAGATATMPVVGEGCPSWVFLNRGGQGYFRTAYAPAMLGALSRDVGTRLSAPERLTLLGDEWALVKAGRHSIADYLTLASGFSTERSSAIVEEITRRLDYASEYLTTPASRPDFERFVRSLLGPIAASVGLRETSSESDEQRELRATVFATLGRAGNDPEVASDASRLVRGSLDGTTTLDPTSAAMLLRLAARSGGPDLWQQLFERSRVAADPAERYRFLYALASFEDPALIDRGLRLTLTDDIRSQDTALYLYRFLSNPVTRERTWTFAKANWSALRPKIVVSGGDIRFVQGLGTFCDSTARDDVRQFFAKNRLPAVSRTLDQTFETITTCMAIRQREAPALAAWVAAR